MLSSVDDRNTDKDDCRVVLYDNAQRCLSVIGCVRHVVLYN